MIRSVLKGKLAIAKLIKAITQSTWPVELNSRESLTVVQWACQGTQFSGIGNQMFVQLLSVYVWLRLVINQKVENFGRTARLITNLCHFCFRFTSCDFIPRIINSIFLVLRKKICRCDRKPTMPSGNFPFHSELILFAQKFLSTLIIKWLFN